MSTEQEIEDFINKTEAIHLNVIKNGPPETPFCVISKNGTNFGCYKTPQEAHDRLKNVRSLQIQKGKTDEPSSNQY